MESKWRTTVINWQVPMAEMLTYGTIPNFDDAG